MRRTTSALTTAAFGGVLTASFVWAQQPMPAGNPARSGTAASNAGGIESGGDSDPLSGIPVQRGARYLMRNGLDYLKYQQYERALGFLREAEAQQKQLNDPEKKLLKQGIERARQGMRMASNAESPYALSEQSRHRSGFVPAKSDGRAATDTIKTAVAAPLSDTKAKRRPARASSNDLELKRADSEEPIRLTSSEVVSDTDNGQTDNISPSVSTASPRNGSLPHIPKLNALPPLSEVPNVATTATPDAGQQPAPLEIAMTGPAAVLPTVSTQPIEATSVPAEPAGNAQASDPPAPKTARVVTEPVAPTISKPEAGGRVQVPNAEIPNDSTAIQGPATALSLADAGGPGIAEPQPTPVPVLPKAALMGGSESNTTTAPADGLALSTPPASGEVSAATPPVNQVVNSVPAEPMPTIAPVAGTATMPAPATSVSPAPTEPVISTPPVVSLEPAATSSTEAARGVVPDRAADSGAVRVANSAPAPVYSPSAEGMPPLPDELGRSAESTPAATSGATHSVPSSAAADAVAPLSDALPPLPVELGLPSLNAGNATARASSTSPTITTVPDSGQAQVVSPVEPAPTIPAATDRDEPSRLALPTPVETGLVPASVLQPSAIPAESEPARTQAVAEVGTSGVVNEAATAAVAVPEAQPAPAPTMPASTGALPDVPASAATDAPATGASNTSAPNGDPFLPERKNENSNLRPQLIREVEEIARKQEDELHNQAGAPVAQPPATVRDTSPTDLKTQFQLDISRAPSPAEARPIKAIPVPEDWVPLGQRNWAPQRKYWAAAATCHLPLYFQDPMLERYGHNVEQFTGPIAKYLSYPVDDPRQSTQNNQLIQPFFSAGLMALQIVALPYNLVMDPPWEAQYDLGYYRPGDVIPTDTYWLPLHGYGPPLRGNSY